MFIETQLFTTKTATQGTAGKVVALTMLATLCYKIHSRRRWFQSRKVFRSSSMAEHSAVNPDESGL